MIKKCVQNHLNKLMAVSILFSLFFHVVCSLLYEHLKVEEPPNFVPRVWLCAFCGHRSCHGELGDLFGPYYVSGVRFPTFLPPVSAPTGSQVNGKTVSASNGTQAPSTSAIASDENADVWFHLGCALWTPNLLFFCGKFPHLAEALADAWRKVSSSYFLILRTSAAFRLAKYAKRLAPQFQSINKTPLSIIRAQEQTVSVLIENTNLKCIFRI